MIVHEEETMRTEWPLAKIVDVIPSSDGLIRRLRLQMGNPALDRKSRPVHKMRTIERPIQKVTFLTRPNE